jgi:hypothetical protein
MKMRVLSAAVACCLLWAWATNAATFNVQISQPSPSYMDNVTVTFVQTGVTENGGAGPFNFTFLGAKPDNYPTSFTTYCVDLYDNIGWSTYSATPANFPTAPLSETPHWVSGDSGEKAAFLYDNYQNSVNSTTKGAGLQLAIWEVLYGADTNSNNNLNNVDYDYTKVFTISATAAVKSEASRLIALSERANWGNTNGVLASQYQSTWWQMTDASGVVVQHLIGPALVPEPAEMAIVGVGIMASCIGAQQLRQRRKLLPPVEK